MLTTWRLSLPAWRVTSEASPTDSRGRQYSLHFVATVRGRNSLAINCLWAKGRISIHSIPEDNIQTPPWSSLDRLDIHSVSSARRICQEERSRDKNPKVLVKGGNHPWQQVCCCGEGCWGGSWGVQVKSLAPISSQRHVNPSTCSLQPHVRSVYPCIHYSPFLSHSQNSLSLHSLSRSG